MMPNEDYYYKAIIYADGPDFSPPGISCEYTSQKIVYNGTYSNTCTYRNFSSNTVYLKLEDADFYSHLAGTWHARYREAVFRHDFDSEIITLNPYQTLRQDKTATINEIDSPDTRNVNLSLLDASYRYSLCLDSSCSQILENLSYSDVLVTIGYGTGKYLGVQDPGAFSTTSTELGASPAYNAYFNLRNPNTRYNETVDGDDYDIDIQIIKDGDKWYQDASTAVRHYKFLVKDLNQEPGVRPVPRDGRGDPIFRDDNGRAYSFFYKIPDIDQIPSNQLYKLYITTIWKNHPRTGLDEPIDQVKRSFAPGLDLELEDVYLPAGQNTVSTFNNSIWNFGSFPVDIEIKLLQNVENFSISTSLPIKFTLGAGDKINFQIDFEYSGSKPSTDVTGNLTGSSLMEIVEEFVSSDFDSATITIEKSGPPSPPTAHNLFVTPPNSTDYCPPYIGYPDHPPVRVNWEFYDPGDSQSAFKIEVDDDPDFRSLAAETGRIFSSASSYVFQKSGERLSWGKTYYWSLKVWDRDNKPSDWIYPPNPPGETTLRPGTPFQTTHPFPEPDFDWLPEDPTAKEVIQFTDLSQFHDSSKSWFWNFGDGQSSTDQNPTHSYSSLGNYNIILTVTDSDDYGCSLARTLGIGMQLPEWREIPPF
ncbi:PKD domain-containing protein [Patescibacteria group bacterium]|nr:PKD domain-containing protein [Patescibacteria group bacterium]